MRTLALSIALGMLSSAAWAQAQPTSPPLAGERLSDWLLRTHGPLADTTALHWLHHAQRHPQGQLKQQVLQDLRTSALLGLSDWLSALPTTGRLTLATTQPRALQAVPQHDPVAEPASQFVLYPRPQHVVVINEHAQPCAVLHQPGATPQHYLQACQAHTGQSLAVDHVWLAQPDGRTIQVGIAPWALTVTTEPAPGTYMWAPSRQSGLSIATSGHIAQLLATQPPPAQHPAMAQVLASSIRIGAISHTAPAVNATHTRNDWGELGYWQTPSARLAPAGTVSVTFSRVAPYTRLTTLMQPLDWFEGGFRYTSVSNRLYGPSIAGDQAYKDKSIDFKIQLLPEGPHIPQVALGLRDIGGTGLFSSEYLVASKRWGDWDTSLGIAWGNLGSRGNVRNPLASLGDRFKNRPVPTSNVNQAGKANFDTLFAGPAAIIGGVQWASPTTPWVIKAELDGNSYQNEPQDNNQRVTSPINLGVLYRLGPKTSASLSWQRGQQVMLGLSWSDNLSQLYIPKSLDPALPLFTPQAPAALPPRQWADVAAEIERHTSWQVQQVAQQHRRVVVRAQTNNPVYLQARIDRVIAILHALAPQELAFFELHLYQQGLPLSQVHIDRAEWVLQRSQPLPSASALPAQVQYALDTVEPLPNPVWQAPRQGLNLFWAPTYSQILGGPDGFVLYDIGVALNADWRFGQHSWLNGALKARLLDNYDKFKYTAPSNLPRVRTFAREYTTTSRVTLPVLQLNHAQALGAGHYASVYGGLLEPMFGGVGAEWLYRPMGSRWAVGVDVNNVRQRSFEQDFAFRDYRVNTGHLSLYWDTGFHDIHAHVQVGRYLAGDDGVTLDLKRTFANGVAIGAWATKTNVSSAQFGEGSFDKGIYVSVPFDALSPRSTPGQALVVWNPLTRDGGARLGRSTSLFDLTNARSPRGLSWFSAQPAPPRSAEPLLRLDSPQPHPLGGVGQSARTLAHQITHIPGTTWLGAAGVVLGAVALDTKADRWAQQHQTGTAHSLGRVANATPYIMAAGVGAMSTGVFGAHLATTAQTSLYAGAYAIGASMAVRGLTGRSRPFQAQGSQHWAGPGRSSFDSGFVSNHTALAFALATPFAREYQAPWLYGVASLTAFGRVQKREHWVSDTVGGALLGFGVGYLLSEQQTRQVPGQPRIHLSANRIQADWSFH